MAALSGEKRRETTAPVDEIDTVEAREGKVCCHASHRFLSMGGFSVVVLLGTSDSIFLITFQRY